MPSGGPSSFDLKSFWDHGLYVVVVGVWSQSNMLLTLNPDLTGRMEELEISWSLDALLEVVRNGCFALNISFSSEIEQNLDKTSYANVGMLQGIVLMTLDERGVTEAPENHRRLGNETKCDDAIMLYAGQLESRYSKFAEAVSSGIRKRKDATGIYAHAMAVILSAEDEVLTKGLSLDDIFTAAYARQSRIQKGNLRSVLEKIEELQVDEDGRGLVFSYNSMTGSVTVVDKQILLYRAYRTVHWPWESLIRESEEAAE